MEDQQSIELEALLAPPVPKVYNSRDYIVGVKVTKIGKHYPFDYSYFPDIQIGDRVIVQNNAVGLQIGEVKRFVSRQEVGGRYPIPYIHRMATPADLLTQQQWQERDLSVLIECREKAKHLGRYKGVKFVTAEYNFNGSLLNIFYTSDDLARIDTAPLRGQLSRQLSVAVEFKQIGAREVAKLQGGLGACGIPRCCSTFLTDFSPVTITMAKAQGIPLSTADLSGACGRLRCCLAYEYEQYMEARRHLPAMRKRVGTPHGEGRVVDVHPMEDEVSVKVDEVVHRIHRDQLMPLQELAALKKAAATPCSKNEGGGCDCGSKRERGNAEELLNEMAISPDALAAISEDDSYDDENIAKPAPQAKAEGERRQHSRNRRHGNRQRGNVHASTQANAETPTQSAPTTPKPEGEKKPNRQHNRRRNNQRRSNNQRKDGPQDGNQA